MVQMFTHGMRYALVLLYQLTLKPGLSNGTYTCTVSDTVNGYSTSVAVTIGGNSNFYFYWLFSQITSPINTDGAVSLSVSGGSPCFNGAALIR